MGYVFYLRTPNTFFSLNQQYVIVDLISFFISIIYFSLVKLQYDMNEFNKIEVEKDDGRSNLSVSEKIDLIYPANNNKN
jgi:hypothetical protein